MDSSGDRIECGPPLVPLHSGTASETQGSIVKDILTVGAACRSDVINSAQVDELRDFVDHALASDDEWHAPGDRENAGRVTFLPRYGALPLELLDNEGVMGPIDEILGEGSELYTMTTLCQAPGATSRPVHLDVTYQPQGFILGVGAIVLLDDYTELSGPMRIYPEIPEEEPAPEDFEERAQRVIAPAGSVCWMNAGAWHDVLSNSGTTWRRSILLAMGLPWVRQRFDMVRMLSHLDIDSFSDRVKRHLGLLSIPPGSYEDYYLPPEGRREAFLRRALDRI